MKEELSCEKYLRYVDDFALFSDDFHYLNYCRQMVEDYLTSLRLKIHPIKSQLFETRYGVNFVGFRILPISEHVPKDVRIRVRNDNLRRSRHRMKAYQRDYARGNLSFKDLIQRLRSWEAHLYHANTYGLRRNLFAYWSFQRCEIQDSANPKKLEKIDFGQKK